MGTMLFVAVIFDYRVDTNTTQGRFNEPFVLEFVTCIFLILIVE